MDLSSISLVTKTRYPMLYIIYPFPPAESLSPSFAHPASTQIADELIKKIRIKKSGKIFSLDNGTWKEDSGEGWKIDEVEDYLSAIQDETNICPAISVVLNNRMYGVYNEKENILVMVKYEGGISKKMVRCAYLSSVFLRLKEKEIHLFQNVIDDILSLIPQDFGLYAIAACSAGERETDEFLQDVVNELEKHNAGEEEQFSLLSILHFWMGLFPKWLLVPERRERNMELSAYIHLFGSIAADDIPDLLISFYMKFLKEPELKSLYTPIPRIEDLKIAKNLLNKTAIDWDKLIKYAK